MKCRLLALAAMSVFALPAFADSEAALKTIKQYDTSLNNGDLNGVMSTLDKDAVLYPSSGAPHIKGESELKTFFQNYFDATKSRIAHMPTNPEVQDYGNIVVRSGESSLDFVMKDGKEVNIPIRSTFLVKKNPDGWKIVHIHVSKSTATSAQKK